MVALAITAVVVAAVAFGGGDGAPGTVTPQGLDRQSVGSGAEQATIVKPAGLKGPAPGIIFFHGWGETDRDDYKGWIDHLARQGNVVIAPRYQTSEASPPETVLPSALAGIRSAVARAPIERGTAVVAGHSAGAALAADYAATAAGDPSLPRPVAVYSVYPGRAILGTGGIPPADASAIPSSTWLVALAADADKIVGEAPALELLDLAVQIPESRKDFVEVTDPAVDGHWAPLRDDRAAREAFWAPLDALIARAR